ncbi:MAG TPA: hypothetical protein VKB67_07685, partial [Rhizomicrobium sp.]|nr:hypothetical protein [Rhizomicrobium sp.]
GGYVQFTRLDSTSTSYEQVSKKLYWGDLLKLSLTTTEIGTDWANLVENLHGIRDSENGLKYRNRVWHIAIRERAYGLYKRVKRFICR